MARTEEACPYPTSARAGRCEGCCETNGSLTPCVLAWLAAATVDVLREAPVRRFAPRGTRQAA